MVDPQAVVVPELVVQVLEGEEPRGLRLCSCCLG